MENTNSIDISKLHCLIDLHLHLDGSMSLSTVRKLAQMQNISLPESDDELRRKLQVSEDCADLNEYLQTFELPVALLQTREAINESVYCLQEELKQHGLMYAEIRFAPQLHIKNGLTQEQVVEAALEGLRRSDFHAGLILCCMRMADNHQENLETIQQAEKFLGNGVVAVDLAGAEGLFATNEFAKEFQLAKKLSIPFTIHAGEADGPASIRKAIEFGAARIGHGVRALEDDKLVTMLADCRIPLEMCPTSNLNTRVFEEIKKYPIMQYLKAGVLVTINTDNMMVSGTTVDNELEKLQHAFSLTHAQIETLLINAADAAFTDIQTKNRLKQKIEEELKLFL